MSISQGETYFTLMQGDTQVLRIAKSTGHIYDIDEDYTVNFQKATSSRPSAFVVENSEGTTVYSWSYSLHSPVFAQIAEGRDMSSLATGIYLTSDHVRLIKASSQDPSIPDGAYVIDAYGKPIIAIDARGQIYTLDTDAVLEYREGEYGNTIRFASSE